MSGRSPQNKVLVHTVLYVTVFMSHSAVLYLPACAYFTVLYLSYMHLSLMHGSGAEQSRYCGL